MSRPVSYNSGMRSRVSSVPLATTSFPTCPAGHPFTVENTYLAPHTGWRQCKTCRREYQRMLRARRRAERPPKEPRPPRRWIDRRRTCVNGHVYPPDTPISPSGKRICLECQRARQEARIETKWYAAGGERKPWSKAVAICKNGHIYPANTPIGADGRRLCPTCKTQRIGMTGPRQRITTAERLWRRVQKGKAEDCWLWPGATNGKGYGVIGIGTRADKNLRQAYVHRVAWELANGPIPPGLTIDHLCHTRNCVNVQHMEIVTLVENIRRAHRRKRS
jgi:hypothetical protein